MLSIELLSFAAEATVVLLLLAVSWPQGKATSVQDIQSETERNWEPAKFFYLQSCVHRGLYLQQWCKTQKDTASNADGLPSTATPDPYVPRRIEDDANAASVPFPWQDRLTRLLNRPGFDIILKEWLAVLPNHRGESCLSMVTLSSYSDLVSTHGAMVTEQALKSVALHLSSALSSNAILARYLPDRFVVLHFSSSMAARQEMAAIQQCISSERFFMKGGQPLQLASTVCILDLIGNADGSSQLDELDEGSIAADQTVSRIVSRVDGKWKEDSQSAALLKFNANLEVEANADEELDPRTSEGDVTAVEHAQPDAPANTSLPNEPTTSTGNQSDEKNTMAESSPAMSADTSTDDAELLIAETETKNFVQAVDSLPMETASVP